MKLPLRYRIVYALPPFWITLGLIGYLVLTGYPTSAVFYQAIGEVSIAWLYALILATTADIVLTLLPERTARLQVEIAVRILSAPLWLGYAVAVWAYDPPFPLPDNLGVQGILAWAIGFWELALILRARKRLRELAAAAEVLDRIAHEDR